MAAAAVRAFGSAPEYRVIEMPQLSPSMTDGTVASWVKKAGDEIELYDIFMDVRPPARAVVPPRNRSHFLRSSSTS